MVLLQGGFRLIMDKDQASTHISYFLMIIKSLHFLIYHIFVLAEHFFHHAASVCVTSNDRRLADYSMFSQTHTYELMKVLWGRVVS